MSTRGMTDDRAHDLRRLVKNFLGLGIGNYGALAASLLINALLTRRLGTENFGHLALLLMASQMLSLLAASWTQMGVVRFGAVEFSASGAVSIAMWTRVWIAAPWAAAGALILLIGHSWFAAYLGIPAWGLILVFAHFVVAFVLTTIGAVFQARDQMRRYGVVLFLDKAIMAALLLVVPIAWVPNPLIVVAFYAASSSVAAICGVQLLGWGAVWPMTFDRAMYRQMLVFSLPLILSSWAGLIGGSWFDLPVIKAYRPHADVGLYQLGVTMAGVVQQITVVFSTLLLPQMSVLVAQGEQAKIQTFIDRLLPYWFLLLSILLCLVILTATTIVPLAFGAAFIGSVPVLVWLALATCALALFNAFSPLVVAMGSTWTLTGICLVSGAANVVMDFVLIPRFGIAGSAFATVVSYSVSAALVLAFVRRHVGGRVASLGLLALPVVVMAAGFFVLSGYMFYVVAIPAGIVSLLWLVSHFRLFRAEDAVYLQGLRLPASLVGRTP